MADILPGYSYDGDSHRYRSSDTGRYVARRDILGLLNTQINSAEQRWGDLVTAYHEGRISASTWQSTMRDEARRLHSQNRALGVGGWDRMQFGRDWGAVGGRLGGYGGDYGRMENLAHGIANGSVSLPQALERVRGYVGNARIQFWEADRDAARQTGRQYEERRRLGSAEHCADCVEYASMSWQPLGTLYPPGEGSACSTHCRCTLERREVSVQESGR